MSATAIAALSALGGIILQAIETRERIKQAALEAGEITVQDLQDQDTVLLTQLQRLKDLIAPPQP